MLVVDISASSRYSHTSRLKSELIAELAALLAFSAIKNQDKVGLLLFSSEIELYLSPKKGVRHVLRVMRDLLYFTPKNKGTDLQNALAFLGQVQRRHAICFLISDFIAHDFDWQAALIAKRHELIAFQVYDAYEHLFEPKGLFTLRDLESQEEAVVDTSDPMIRTAYEQQAQNQQVQLKKLFNSIGAEFVPMSTSESSANVLQKFFKLRQRKR